MTTPFEPGQRAATTAYRPGHSAGAQEVGTGRAVPEAAGHPFDVPGMVEPPVPGCDRARYRRLRRIFRQPVSGGEIALVVAALTTAALLGGHRLVPEIGGFGNMLDSVLPWLGLPVPLFALLALIRRFRVAGVAVLVPALVWAVLFGSAWLPGGAAGQRDLRVVTQNLYAGNPRPDATAAALVHSGADLVAVQELTSRAAVRALGGGYPEHVEVGTVGLWSRYPIVASRRVDLGLGWFRALRAEVRTPHGDLVVYVAHLGSLRPGQMAERDRSLDRLAGVVRADPARRVLLLGDLNTAGTDRRFDALTGSLAEAQDAVGTGPGFTWPAAFPLCRLDHVLYRGLTPVRAEVLATGGSDHDAATADLRW